jgi:hypothetical protein
MGYLRRLTLYLKKKNVHRVLVENLKDYAIKAFVNTVDHLGSVAYKVNGFLDEKICELSRTELRVSCIEQVFLCFFSLFCLSAYEYW